MSPVRPWVPITITSARLDLARRVIRSAGTLLFDRRALRYLIDMIGTKRIVVGTDYPYMAPEQPADRTLRTLGLPPDVHEDITWHNCFRFLGVEPPVVTT